MTQERDLIAFKRLLVVPRELVSSDVVGLTTDDRTLTTASNKQRGFVFVRSRQ